jgi:hypothetical protein
MGIAKLGRARVFCKFVWNFGAAPKTSNLAKVFKESGIPQDSRKESTK